MESSRGPTPTPTDAEHQLAMSSAAQDSFRKALTLPASYSLTTGLGHAALAYGVALGNSTWRFGSVAFVVALTIEATTVAMAMKWFRTVNGAWVSGFRGPRSTRVVVVVFAAALLGCIGGATALMIADRPVLSALVALCALPITAVADRCWMARYRVSR